jgi:hypothetical protein
LAAAGGDDLVDAGDAVVEEVRDPPLLLQGRVGDAEVRDELLWNSLKARNALKRGDAFL